MYWKWTGKLWQFKQVVITAAAHGWFSLIRQVVSMCTPSNTCFLEPIRVHIPNSILIVSAVFAQPMAKSPYTLQWHSWATPFPLKTAPHLHAKSRPHVIHGSLGPPKSTTQIASWLVQPFLQGSRLWQTDGPTDRLTDHATPSVTTGSCSTAMQPKNEICIKQQSGSNVDKALQVMV